MPALIQRTIAGVGLVMLSPVLLAIAIAVRATSPGPALHRATRVRPDGTFTLFKFRTMEIGAADRGPGVTSAGDPRVTRLGRPLRQTKLDELPQLWNVLRGDMLLVGPRPEDPRYVDLSIELHRFVFAARPGVTGPTALVYSDEEPVLATAALDVARATGRSVATDADLDVAYRTRILPAKLAMDADYLRTRSTQRDLRVLGRTIGQVLRRTTER